MKTTSHFVHPVTKRAHGDREDDVARTVLDVIDDISQLISGALRDILFTFMFVPCL